jgi:S-adenosylmethionine hydrolase
VPANVDPKEQEKSYTYSQLIELNDKLTLVVGKEGKQQEIIKYFSDVNINKLNILINTIDLVCL